MQLFVVAVFVGGLELAEHVAAELLEFLLEIVGRDHVHNETNLLQGVFVALSFFDRPLALLDQFLPQGVSLLPFE